MGHKYLALALACAAAPAAAHTDHDDHADHGPALTPVVITAPLITDPVTVETDPKAPRQPVPAADGADLLKNIPGFSVVRKGGTSGDPVLRGLAGSRLNILQDGAEVLGGCGNRMDPPTAYLYPQTFDKVTVVKGPQSVLYGGGNLAGAVLFERRTERFHEPGTRLSGSALIGANGRNDQMLDATAGAEQGFLRLIGTRAVADDYRDGDGNAVHSEYRRWSGTAIAGWTPSDDIRLELSVERSDGEAAYADRGMDGSAFDRTGYGLRFESENVSPLLQRVEAKAYYQYVDHVMDNFSLRTPTGGYMVSNPDRRTQGARALAELALSETSLLSVGADFRQDRHRIRSASGMGGQAPMLGAREPDLETRQLGVFAQLEQAVGERGTWLAGARVDRVEAEARQRSANFGGAAAGTEEDDDNIGGFIRYEHRLDALLLYAGLGHAERSPDYWERNARFDVAPEKSNQLDLGLGYQGVRVKSNLSLFYARIDDYILIDWARDGMGAWQKVGARNVDARTWGFEADAVWTLSARWRVTATLAYVHGDNRSDDKPLAQIPPLEGSLALDYDDGTWSAGALWRVVDSQDRVSVNSGSIAGRDLGETGGFGVLSLHAGYRPNEALTITAGIDNLFDKTYAEHLSRSGSDSLIVGYERTVRVNEPGRVWWLQAAARF